jgi:hypothetical protein
MTFATPVALLALLMIPLMPSWGYSPTPWPGAAAKAPGAHENPTTSLCG